MPHRDKWRDGRMLPAPDSTCETTDTQLGLVAYLRLMMKTPMKMSNRITLPITDTSSTVEFAPSPMMGEGTERKTRLKFISNM